MNISSLTSSAASQPGATSRLSAALTSIGVDGSIASSDETAGNSGNLIDITA